LLKEKMNINKAASFRSGLVGGRVSEDSELA